MSRGGGWSKCHLLHYMLQTQPIKCNWGGDDDDDKDDEEDDAKN